MRSEWFPRDWANQTCSAPQCGIDQLIECGFVVHRLDFSDVSVRIGISLSVEIRGQDVCVVQLYVVHGDGVHEIQIIWKTDVRHGRIQIPGGREHWELSCDGIDVDGMDGT
jgi:hypothetical protein